MNGARLKASLILKVYKEGCQLLLRNLIFLDKLTTFLLQLLLITTRTCSYDTQYKFISFTTPNLDTLCFQQNGRPRDPHRAMGPGPREDRWT